ncbi:MAG TPA: hypothetical protein PK251_03910 [Candidatus Latescibacteria bacterium]|nr:hypothetical protein [Candidatus Latescibacterota bacterium]HOS63884.1 hypothetical protein [Candidatus Latescibacterota bacterium]HPK73827.1 hypothetical protein [Candidatus Latescibacterota bacterium]
MSRGIIFVSGLFVSILAGCDLLNQTAVIDDTIATGGVSRPVTLSRPDSVLKMLTYIFDRHTPESVQEYADLLFAGYVYRYDDPTDKNDLELDRASEIQVYRNLFRSFDYISAHFAIENRWIEYGADMPYPPGTALYQISSAHATENWVVLRVLGDLIFTNTDNNAVQTGYQVRQRFDIAFRLDTAKSDSTWQIASWSDRESLLNARIAVRPAENAHVLSPRE